jgi:glutathione S-transferase
LLYPQLFPHHKRRTDEAHGATIEWGQKNSKKWLQILNDHWIGPNKNYLVGNQITIADYFGACLLTAGDLIRCDFSAYPNIRRWLDTVKQQPGWDKTNEALYGLAGHLKEQQFVQL